MELISAARHFGCAPNPIFIYRESHEGSRAVHRHDFYEIGFVCEGSATQVTMFGAEHLRPGNTSIITPSAWHGLSHANGLRMEFCCFSASLLNVELAGLMANPKLQSMLGNGIKMNRGVLSFDIPNEALTRCLELTDLIAVAAGGWSAADGNATMLSAPDRAGAFWKQIAYLILLLLTICEYCGDSRQVDHSATSEISRVTATIDDAPELDWSNHDLASIACLEPSYFIRRFRREIGVSPGRYLLQVRMQAASDLLLRTCLPIQKIGERCGLPDAAYFSLRFKGFFGLSPTDYRRKYRAQTYVGPEPGTARNQIK